MVMIGCLLGIACSVIPYSLEMEVLRRMSARVFGVLMSLQPAVAAIIGWLMLGQSLSARSVVAIVIVVVAGAAATTEGDHPLME
jgi:inner membrane transporter RhtA